MIDFEKEMKEIDEIRNKRVEGIFNLDKEFEELDEIRSRQMEEMIHDKYFDFFEAEENNTKQKLTPEQIEKIRIEKHKKIDAESDKFSDKILASLKELTDEEISNLIVLSLNDDAKLNKIATIYITNTAKKGEEYIEPIKVAREALNKALRVVKTRIEMKHKEFPRVEPVKRMKL